MTQNKKEYMVHVWGGAWNKDANPSIEKDLGIKKGYHYFDTKKEKDYFLKKINHRKYKTQGLAIDEKYGYMSHMRTIFVGTFKYNEEIFILHYDFGYEYPEEKAIFMFTDGNYSCDCNRSDFIRCEYGNVIPELGCGHKIEMVRFKFEYKE